MAMTVIVHVVGTDPVTFSNPRRRDGKPLPYVDDGSISVIFPWHRISFIEVMPSEEIRGEIDLFFRD